MYSDALQHKNQINWPQEDAELRYEADESLDNLLAYILEDDIAGENNVDEERGEQDLVHNADTDIQETVGDDTSRNKWYLGILHILL